MAATRFEVGSWARVRDNCPLTLPLYARLSAGQVTEAEGDAWVLTFPSGRVFPVPEMWLEPAPAPAPIG